MDAVSIDCARLRVGLGAYVLGALDAAERAELEEHLSDCPGCRDELVSLAALPGLLARVDPAGLVDDDGSAPDRAASSQALAARAVEELRARRRTRRPVLSGLVAAVAVLALVAGGSWVRNAFVDGGTTTVAATDPASHVWVEVRMDQRDSGTSMNVRLAGAYENAGGPYVSEDDERCALIAVSRDGRRETAATWGAASDGSARAVGQVSIPIGQLRSLEVVTLSGKHLVTVPVT
ncbi:anti-sigma factor family protein [Spongisporangium articulatum]|uniref:Anti-sigma factor family protein n=1 Tax=Spongisporangium articulatum TaxID=3362603 RepID=A0ABW8AID3_9ACTN